MVDSLSPSNLALNNSFGSPSVSAGPSGVNPARAGPGPSSSRRRKSSASTTTPAAASFMPSGSRVASADPAPKRTSKACENCRIRRTKCVGGQPCKACVELGMRGSCMVRTKARPNRALPKLFEVTETTRPESTAGPSRTLTLPSLLPAQEGRRHAQFVDDVELSLEAWAADRNVVITLALPPSSLLSPALSLPAPPLPSDPEGEAATLEHFIERSPGYSNVLAPQRLRDLAARYLSAPDSLAGDQLAVILACLCLARHTGQSRPGGASDPAGQSGPDAMGEAVLYARHALRTLDRWGSASCLALNALHILHLFCQGAGGPAEIRDILGRMAWQVTELGLHRRATARTYPPSDQVGRLFYMTLYKDSWFASLCGETPFLRYSEVDMDLPLAQVPDGLEAGIDTYPFLVQLTLYENQLLTLAHIGKEFSVEFVLETEGKWGVWMSLFRDEQESTPRPVLYAFASIRFHWLRLMLRAPLLSHPLLRLSSLAIMARSLAHILHTYTAFAHSPYFFSTWGEVRRITTCAHLLCVAYWEKELEKAEAEVLAGMAEALLQKLEAGCTFADGARGNLRRLFGLLGLNPKPAEDSPISPLEAALGPLDASQTQTLFDYTLPADMDPWLEGLLFDYDTANLPASNST